MLFGGKREKELEEELREAQETSQKRQQALAQIAEQGDGIPERFAHMTASRAQTERGLAQMKESAARMAELSESGSKAARELGSAVREISNGMETFAANHAVFLGEAKTQSDEIAGIAEENKYFTTPMETILEAAKALCGERETLHERAARMAECSKDMSVLSLKCAIEAGKLGDAGMEFLSAAEKIRALSVEYEREVQALKEQLCAADERGAALEEQAHQLNERLKENNSLINELLKGSKRSLAVYEASQLNLRELLPEAFPKVADVLCQTLEECCGLKEELTGQLDEAADGLREQKQDADELESMCRNMLESARSDI